MLFNSLPYLLFFPLVCLLYLYLPRRLSKTVLLAAGLIFYTWFYPPYLPVGLLMIALHYYAGLRIERAKEQHKPYWLRAGIIMGILILAGFKYSEFLMGTLSQLSGLMLLKFPMKINPILVPLGLSFQLFMGISYLLEIRRANIQAERNPLNVALYLMFFPIAVAGPIERPQHLIPQFDELHRFEYTRVVSGLRRVLWGFFKKIVLADNLIVIVNAAYQAPDAQNGLSMLLATFLFAFQLYFDFSGYSDIAIGCARILGFKVSENFNHPYTATSVTDFWRRWHISLSSWLRDYLFMPLSVKWRNAGKAGMHLALFLTFVICGLWHGASFTFIIWGALHGLIMIAESFFLPVKKKKKTTPGFGNMLKKGVSMLYTFSMLMLTWVFFRSADVPQALHILKKILMESPGNIRDFLHGLPVFNGFGSQSMMVIALLIAASLLMMLLERIMNEARIVKSFERSAVLRMLIYFVLLYSIVFLGNFGDTVFVYSKF
jgi:D-alanyl-lipoteichoic acid acyltransferase DltB (MBOAT superfamily)